MSNPEELATPPGAHPTHVFHGRPAVPNGADHASPSVHPLLPHFSADLSVGDWDMLFDAVKDRIRSIVGEQPLLSYELPAHDIALRVRASVLECVAALDQLHTMLMQERARRRQLQTEVCEVRVALAQTLSELVGTQAGERQALHQAQHDALTALPNRRFFFDRLEHELTRIAPVVPTLAVLYLDLDGLKQINDSHGQDAGDELLKIVAARLAGAVRADDTVSRLGGDEFACLLVNPPSREQLGHLAGKLIDSVSAPLIMGSLKVTVRPSIGIAVSPVDGSTVEALLRSADAAMYSAKRQRTGHAFVDGRTPS